MDLDPIGPCSAARDVINGGADGHGAIHRPGLGGRRGRKRESGPIQRTDWIGIDGSTAERRVRAKGSGVGCHRHGHGNGSVGNNILADDTLLSAVSGIFQSEL